MAHSLRISKISLAVTLIFSLPSFTSFSQTNKFGISLNSLTTNFNYGKSNSQLQPYKKKAKYYFCKADIPRGLNAHELEKQAAKYGLKGESFSSVRNALKTAKENATKKDMILVAGSVFIVAEVL